MKISSLDLYKAKEACLSSIGSKRLILQGSYPILLSTSLIVPRIKNSEYIANHLYDFDGSIRNYYTHSYLDGFVSLMNQVHDIYGIIDYVELSDNPMENVSQLGIIKYYRDKTIREMLKEHKIDAFFHMNVGRGPEIEVHERNSSFSFLGLTDMSVQLSDMLCNEGIPTSLQFGGEQLEEKEFDQFGYSFTDDTISYNQFFSLGRLKNRLLTRDEMCPRNLQISVFHGEDRLDQMATVFGSYLEWVKQELHEKGSYQAMGPMKSKVKK